MELYNLDNITKKQLTASLEEVSKKGFLDMDGNPIQFGAKEIVKMKRDDLALAFRKAVDAIKSIKVDGKVREIEDSDLTGEIVEGYKNLEAAQLSKETVDRYLMLKTKPVEPPKEEEPVAPTKQEKVKKEKKEKPKKEPVFAINRSEAVILAMLELGEFVGPDDLGAATQIIYSSVNKKRTPGSLKEAVHQAKKGITYLTATNWLEKKGEKYVVVNKKNVQQLLPDEVK